MANNDDTFASLEASFLIALAEAHARAEADAPPGPSSALRQATSLLTSMKLEARTTAPGAQADALAARVTEHVQALAHAQRVCQAASSASLMSRSNEGGSSGGSAPPSAASADARLRASAATEKLAGGSEKLRAAQASLEATVATAEASLGELAAQRETMGRIVGRATATSALADEATAITKRMSSFWRTFGL